MSLRLIWELIEVPRLLLALGFLGLSLFAYTNEGYLAWLYYFVCILFAAHKPVVDGFKSLGLTSRDWNLQRRVENTLFALAIFAILLIHQPVPWLFIALYPIIAAAIIIPQHQMPERSSSRMGELLNQSEGRTKDGWWPNTIEGQLIIGPQVRAWGYMLAIAVVSAIITGAMGAFFNGEWVETMRMLALVASVALFIVFEPVMSDSLREYITFGGTRKTWAHYSIVINAVLPGLMILIGLIVPNLRWFTALGSAYLLIALVMLGLGTLSFSIWPIALIVAGLALEGYILIGIGFENYQRQAAVALGAYVLAALLLPTLARRTNLQSNGLSRWLGIKTSN